MNKKNNDIIVRISKKVINKLVNLLNSLAAINDDVGFVVQSND